MHGSSKQGWKQSGANGNRPRQSERPSRDGSPILPASTNHN